MQGQLLVTGIDWCDFVIFADDDILVQHINRDAQMAAIIREKGDFFYFFLFLHGLILSNHSVNQFSFQNST